MVKKKVICITVAVCLCVIAVIFLLSPYQRYGTFNISSELLKALDFQMLAERVQLQKETDYELQQIAMDPFGIWPPEQYSVYRVNLYSDVLGNTLIAVPKDKNCLSEKDQLQSAGEWYKGNFEVDLTTGETVSERYSCHFRVYDKYGGIQVTCSGQTLEECVNEIEAYVKQVIHFTSP